MRFIYLVMGWLALIVGAIGIFLPLLPTVPLVILAAFCFARSSPRLEAWLVEHRHMGPHIRAWRTRGAISRRGKLGALAAFLAGIIVSLIFVPWPWPLATVLAACICVPWLWSRPDA